MLTYGPMRSNGEYPVYTDGVYRGWVCKHFSSWSYGIETSSPMIGQKDTRKAAVQSLLDQG